jgi:hypothetical protein
MSVFHITAATELESQQQQAEAEAAFAIDQRIRSKIREGRSAVWGLAEACYEFDEACGWYALGIDDLNEYLGDPEIGLSRSYFQRLVRAWRRVVARQLHEHLPELEPNKLDIVMVAVDKGQELLQDAIADAKSLSRSDIIDRYVTKRESPEMRAPGQGDTGGALVFSCLLEDTPEPVRADELDVPVTRVEIEPKGEATPADGASGVSPDDRPPDESVGANDLRQLQLANAQREIENALKSGAGFPRVSRGTLEVCASVLGRRHVST